MESQLAQGLECDLEPLMTHDLPTDLTTAHGVIIAPFHERVFHFDSKKSLNIPPALTSSSIVTFSTNTAFI